jgi:FtsP/CotA-like multicopper oxidase with cupredoxin domain
MLTDILTLGQGDSGIIEIKYGYPGKYMFHSHINEFAYKGWMGFFDVKK